MDYRKQAYKLIEKGISILPLREDGGKRPAILWKEFQDRLMTKREVEMHFAKTTGIAAITGEISRLLCIDFDLDKQLEGQDYWKEFCNQIPSALKKKMLVNSTRKGGKHIWMRTDFVSKSNKITHRYLTIPELKERYDDRIAQGLDPMTVSNSLLIKPLECVIETRSHGSYAVISHPSYERFYGKELQEFSEDEVNIILDACYNLDCDFTPRRKVKGEARDYKVIVDFNDETSAEDVLIMLQSTGLYTYVSHDYKNNILVKRVGSPSNHSAYIYADSGVFKSFGQETLFTNGKAAQCPFDVYCAVYDLTEEEAIEKLKK